MTNEITYAIFDHPAPGLRFSFFPVRDNESNREKSKQYAKNMARLESATHEGLVMEWTRIKGWGIRASRKFLKEDLVLRYCGSVVSDAKGLEIEKKLLDDGIDDSYLYFFKLDSRNLCLDATKDDGSYGRLVNHSRLRPNCKAVGFMDGRTPAIGLVASRDILPGEEILYDYGEIRPWVIEMLPWFEDS